LHLGNARTALLAWCFARHAGGEFVLRIEDIDLSRSKDVYLQANVRELQWLGLDWDEGNDVGGRYAPYVQSARQDRYEQALKQLEPDLFACYLSRKDLREMASAPHESTSANTLENTSKNTSKSTPRNTSDNTSAYGAHEREHNQRLQAQKQAEGKLPSWRWRVPDKTVCFEDGVFGETCLDAHADIGDVVLKRADGMWAYHLAVVVDDIAMKINQVVRGADLRSSTGVHLLLYEAFGLRPPQYYHVPLLLDDSGERLAKRRGGYTLEALRQANVPSERVLGLLAHSLQLAPLEPCSLADILTVFSPDNLPKTPFQVDKKQLEWLLAGKH
jgi:glutamyl-tRNA synthetase